MNKSDYTRYRDYLKTRVGSVDESLFGMALSKRAFAAPLHIVEVECGGRSVLFDRGYITNWSNSDTVKAIVAEMPNDRADKYALQGMESKVFDFSFLNTGESVFANNVNFPTSRNVPSQLKHTGANLWPDMISLNLPDGAMANIKTSETKAFNIGAFVDAMESGDIHKVIEMAKEWNPALPYDAESEEVVLDVNSWPSVSGWMHVPSEDARHRLAYVRASTYDALGTTLPEVIMLAYYGEYFTYGTTIEYRRTNEGSGRDARNLSTEFGKIIESLRRTGHKPTGRVVATGGVSHASNAGSEVVMVGGEQYLHNKDFVVTPYWGIGKSTFALSTQGSATYCFEIEGSFNNGHDVAVLHGNLNVLMNDGRYSGHGVFTGNSPWKGGMISATYGNRSNLDWESYLKFSPDYSDDDGNFVDSDGITIIGQADPFETATLPSVELFRSFDRTPYKDRIFLPRAIWGPLQGLPSRRPVYQPLTGYLLDVDVSFIGDYEVIEDISVLTDDGELEGSPYDPTLEVPRVSNDEGRDFSLEDNGELFGDRDDGNDPEQTSRMKKTLLRYSRVRITDRKVFVSIGPSAIPGLVNGQGIFKPFGANEKKAYSGLAGELKGSSLAMVRYSKPVKVPFNVTDKLVIAVDYAKARKKACLTNDWDQLEYVKGVTWGAVKRKMNEVGSMSEFYQISSTTAISVSPFDSPPVSLTYKPGTSPAVLTLLYKDGSTQDLAQEDEETAWAAIAFGATLVGITLATLSTSWGMADTVTADDTIKTRQAVNDITTKSDVKGAPFGNSPYVFSQNAFASSGFPDVDYMVRDDAYKTMIASIIILQNVGSHILDSIIGQPGKAFDAYIASSLVRQAKWEKKYFKPEVKN